jgi:cyclopropane fatty-acyl-phospholipid synthase-like methyltransferase
MSHSFDKGYWESHWRSVDDGSDAASVRASPYLETELAELEPGTALDAGCGEGAEAIQLATSGWSVTGADISAEALARAARQAGIAGADVEWIEADLSLWRPRSGFDLVTTFYAHPAMPQLAFYERIADWVAPGGTLLIVGHLQDADPGHGHTHGQTGHEHGEPPRGATVTAASVVAVLGGERWEIVTAEERSRELVDPAGRPVALRDVVVPATRRRG